MKPSVQIAQNMRFRLGVGGHWSAHDLELLLVTILGPSGWKVSSRLEPNSQPTINGASIHPEPLGFIEIVALGDGLGSSVGCLDHEELDAIVISPLSESNSIEDSRLVRRHLARFIRQLKPGGATIFAADDPASEIFSAIRLDCRRLGYGLESGQAAFRIDRSDHHEPMHDKAFRLVSPTGNTDWPIASEMNDSWQMALAALAAVDVLGLTSVTNALHSLADIMNRSGLNPLMNLQPVA
jgi:hypothetical protein